MIFLKTLILSVSYFENFCAFLFLLRLKTKQNKEKPTTPPHGPQGPAQFSPCLPVASCPPFSRVHPQPFKVLLSQSGLLSPCFTSANSIYHSRFCSNIIFSQKPLVPRLGQVSTLYALKHPRLFLTSTYHNRN